MPLPGLGSAQGLVNYISSIKANKGLDKLLAQDPTYQQNPLAAQQFAMAQQLFNGRSAGAASQEKNIYQNQASTIANINKNATDSAQALALGTQTQGQANNAFANLRGQEDQNKLELLGNLNRAYEGMINEGDKSYNDKIRRFGDLAQVRGMQQQNKTNGINSMFNGLNSDFDSALQMFGGGGGMGNFFGGGSKGLQTPNVQGYKWP